MDNYQKELISLFENWRPTPKYPVYPPYHEGLYLEDYFIKWFLDNDIESDRYLIPVSWTTCYVDNCFVGLQQEINKLDPSKKYFTVAQHDDAIRENLPSDTISFNAGGNGGGIPIPLICSPIKDINKPILDRDIFCSFVGSITHPIRNNIYNSLHGDKKYYFSHRQWTSSVPESDFNNFLNITSRSIFSLAPRGYGRSSFRLYEVMQLGSIPVFVYDTKWCPFDDEIDWGECSVLIESSDINKIDEMLSGYSSERIKQMQNNLYKYWSENFTMEYICKKIMNRI
jgi:hypothetical protein